ncbi:hypothetical protein Tco_0405762 [Tanacetum coccineum]
MNDVHDRWDKMIESGNKLIQFLGEMLLEQAANIDQSPPQEMSIQDMENLKQHYLDEMLSLSNDLHFKDYRNEKMIFVLEGNVKESNEFIKSSVEDLVPIPSESEDTSESDSDCDLPSCDDFSPINVYEEKSVTFSNPLFDSNDDFTSSDDESLSDEDVPKENVKIYSNPLFKFDDEYISSAVNPHFDEVLENIESGSSEGAGLESDVPDEPKGKSIDTSERTGLKLRVPDVSKADSSESEYESWGDSDDDDDQQGDDERTESDNDKAADLNKTDNEEEDEFVHTPDDYVPTDDENIDD